MGSSPRQSPTLGLIMALIAAIMLGCTSQSSADEIQLAGIRLGQHALNVLQVYGQPDCVVLGATGPGSISLGVGGPGAGAVAGAGPGGGMAGGPGAGPGAAMGMPGAGPGGPPGGGAGSMAPGAGGAGMGPGMGMGEMGQMPGLGGAGDLLGQAMGMGGAMPGMGMGPGAEGAGPGAMGAAAAAAGPGATRFATTQNVPVWAYPVTIEMSSSEQMWCYRRDGVALGFLFDRDGYVVRIAISGDTCDWARTAMGEPKRTVKLGDHFDTVIERYGYPSQIESLERPGFTRDIMLVYGYANNISFHLRDMQVRGIHVWEAQLRGTAPPRLPGSGVGVSQRVGQPESGLPEATAAPGGFRQH